MTQPNSSETVDAIFTIDCREPEGTFTRTVRPLILDRESLSIYWEKASQFKTLFHHNIRTFNDFLSVFLSEEGNSVKSKGLMWVVDDFVGVFFATDIVPTVDCLVHFTFFDRRIRGRDVLASRMVDYLFRELEFRRVSAEIPDYATPPTHKFVKHLGFTHEGVKRKGSKFNNKYFDVQRYGRLAEEYRDLTLRLSNRKDKEQVNGLVDEGNGEPSNISQ